MPKITINSIDLLIIIIIILTETTHKWQNWITDNHTFIKLSLPDYYIMKNCNVNNRNQSHTIQNYYSF